MILARCCGLLLAAGLGAVPPAGAVTLALELPLLHYVAREPQRGPRVLNEDRGDLSSLGISVAGASPADGRWRAAYWEARGGLSYRGLTQIGLPLTTRTDLHLQHASILWAPWPAFRIGPTAWQPALGLGHLRIRRAIRATSASLPLTETLDSAHATFGLSSTWALSGTWQLNLGAQWHRTGPTRLAVNSHGLYDPAVLDPARGRGLRVDAGLTAHVAPGQTLAVAASRETWAFGTGPAEPLFRQGLFAGIASYPGSRHALDGLRITWSTDF